MHYCTAEIKMTACTALPVLALPLSTEKQHREAHTFLRKKMWQKAVADQWIYTSKGVVSTQTCT